MKQTLYSPRAAWRPSTMILALMGLACACAGQTPKELVDARNAYRAAEEGPAAQYTPAQLHTAKKSLILAERTYADEGDTANVRDRAYVAQRKAELATVQARIAMSESRLAKMNAEDRRRQAAELNQARAELEGQRDALAAEQQRRAEAEKRAEQAAADLARIASVKQEERGMVITLSGAVLFPSGKATLLSSAQRKLDEVAQALSQGNPEASIVIEGHTDSQGSVAFNQKLSTLRAEAVRAYLGTHGVEASRMRAEGLGFERPVADNQTAEGRANNRRVEIVVEPTESSAPQPPASAPPQVP